MEPLEVAVKILEIAGPAVAAYVGVATRAAVSDARSKWAAHEAKRAHDRIDGILMAEVARHESKG